MMGDAIASAGGGAVVWMGLGFLIAAVIKLVRGHDKLPEWPIWTFGAVGFVIMLLLAMRR
jgi:hypothetical protein